VRGTRRHTSRQSSSPASDTFGCTRDRKGLHRYGVRGRPVREAQPELVRTERERALLAEASVLVKAAQSAPDCPRKLAALARMGRWRDARRASFDAEDATRRAQRALVADQSPPPLPPWASA
jgi:hypothetical protein